MAARLKQLAAWTVVCAIVWVSPGVEAYAVEAKVAPLSLTTPVNAGPGAALQPLQINSVQALGGGQNLGLPANVVNTVGVEGGGEIPTAPKDLQVVVEGAAAEAKLNDAGIPALVSPVEGKVIAPQGAVLPVPGASQITKKDEKRERGSIIGRGLKALKDAFSLKAPDSLGETPSELTAAASSDSQASKSPEARLNASSSQAPPASNAQEPPKPPTPPAKDGSGGDGGKHGKGPWLGLGLAGFSIIGYMLAMQVGLEAQGVAMPQLTENAFKDFTLLPLVTVFASIGSMVGQPMSRFFSEKFGLAKTFYGAHALRALSLGAMVLLFGFGHMTMPAMMAFYFLNGMVTGVATTAEGTLRKLILAEKGVSMQTYRTWWQLLAESLAVPAPIFFGGLVAKLGAVGAPMVTALYPVTILLGLVVAYLLKVYPLKDVKKASDAAAAQAAAATPQQSVGERKTVWDKLKAAFSPKAILAKLKGVWPGTKSAAGKIFSNMEEGKDYVLSLPYLKYSLIAASVFDLFNIMIYRLIAPGYGKMTGGAAGLSAVQGNIVGMFSLGGLLLSITFITLESMAKRRAAKEKPTPEQAAAAERSSMLRWMFAGIPALALFATMGLHIALPLAPLIFLGTNWMPGSILAAALVPFGFFQVAASIKLNSYFQERLPQDATKVQKALAFSGSVMTAISIVTMLILRPLFSAVTVFNPFPYMAIALAPLAVGLFFLHRKVASATKPEAIAEADAAHHDTGPRKAGSYVGLILGIVGAALVITALPMIPGVGPLLAGLGVLPRFAINLGLTLAVPAVGYFAGRARQRKSAKP